MYLIHENKIILLKLSPVMGYAALKVLIVLHYLKFMYKIIVPYYKRNLPLKE